LPLSKLPEKGSDIQYLCLENYGSHLVKKKKGKGDIPRHSVDNRGLGETQISSVRLSFWDRICKPWTQMGTDSIA
jgi:hypothetical protein